MPATTGYPFRMAAIPGEPLDPKPPKLTLRDGRKVVISVPGLAPRLEPNGTEAPGAVEPPREDPRPGHDPNHGF